MPAVGEQWESCGVVQGQGMGRLGQASTLSAPPPLEARPPSLCSQHVSPLSLALASLSVVTCMGARPWLCYAGEGINRL